MNKNEQKTISETAKKDFKSEDSNVFRTLLDFKGKVAKEVVFSASRKVMVELFTGAVSEKWFIEELMPMFSLLSSRRDGVKFLFSINLKIQSHNPLWIQCIVSNTKELINFAPGCDILIHSFSSLNHEQTETVAKVCYQNIFLNEVEGFRILIDKCLDSSNVSKDMAQLLIGLPWIDNKQHMSYLVRIIEVSKPKVVDIIFSIFSSNIEQLITDHLCVHVLCNIAISSSESTTEHLLVFIENHSFRMIESEPEWLLINEIITSATYAQKQRILSMFKNYILSSTAFPNHFDQLFTKLMISISSEERQLFFSSVSPRILSFKGFQIAKFSHHHLA